MQIIQKVLIKQIITEKSKVKLKEKFQKRKMQLEQECQQLLFEQKKLQRKHRAAKAEIAKRFQEEIDQRKERVELLQFKTEQVDLLEIGSEITEEEVDALVEVKVGSHWNEITKRKAIVIKDDVVIRMDE